MVPCLLDFIFCGNANCVTGTFPAWRFGHWLFAFNCKKEQNNTVNFSERTSFGAVNTFGAKYDTFKNVLLFRAERQPSFWNLLHFFWRALCALAQTFYYVQLPCYCCVTWYETREAFPLLNFHLIVVKFCGVILLHVANVRASFAVPVFLTFFKTGTW